MTNPFSDLDGTNDGDDFPDWLDVDADEPEPVAHPKSAQPQTAPPAPHAPRIFADAIDTDDQATTEWEDTINPEDFGDFTPRKNRFSPPSEETIFGATTERKNSHHHNREDMDETKQEKREEKQRKKQEKQRLREQRREEKLQLKKEKQRLREQRREEKAATAENSDTSQKTAAKRSAGTVIGIATVVCLFAACSLYLFNKTTDNGATTVADTTPPAATSQQPTTSAAPDPATILAETVEKTCSENGGRHGEGDRESPEGTIEGLNHAYYVTKDAHKAASFLDENMYESVEGLQEGIDTPSNGDDFCVVITPTDGKKDTFTVDLTQFYTPADGASTVESDTQKQEITVANSPDGWYITNQALL